MLKMNEQFTPHKRKGGIQLRCYDRHFVGVPITDNNYNEISFNHLVIADGPQIRLEYSMIRSKRRFRKYFNPYACFYKGEDGAYKLLVDGCGRGFMHIDVKDINYFSPVVTECPSLIEGTVHRKPEILDVLPHLFTELWQKSKFSSSTGYQIFINAICCKDEDIEALARFVIEAAKRSGYIVRPGDCL